MFLLVTDGRVRLSRVNPAVRKDPLSAVPADAWGRLVPSGSAPMMSHLWVRTAAEVYARGRPAQVLLVGPPEVPRAAAALYAPGDSPGTLRLLGALDLGESVDLPAESDDALADLAGGLWSLGVPVDLGHLPTDTRLLRHLRHTKPVGAMLAVRSRPERGLPGLALAGDWTDPARAIGRKRRQPLARKRR